METIFVNGKALNLPSPRTLSALMADLSENGNDGRTLSPMVAVELNQLLIRRSDWADTRLKDQDRIEIIQLVGGG